MDPYLQYFVGLAGEGSRACGTKLSGAIQGRVLKLFLNRIAGEGSARAVVVVIVAGMQAPVVAVIVVGVVVMELNVLKRIVFCNNYVVPASLT